MKHRIKEILTEKKILNKDAAKKIGISPQFLSNVIGGRQEPSVSLLVKIADALDVPFWQLFTSPDEIAAGVPYYLITPAGYLFKAATLSELEHIVDQLKNNSEK